MTDPLYVRVTDILARAERFSEAAPPLLELLGSELHCDAGVIWLADAQRVAMRARVFWSRPGLDAAGFRDATLQLVVKRDAGLPGGVFATGETQFIHDIPSTPAREAGMLSALAFPTVDASGVSGVVELYSTEPNPPDGKLLDVLRHVGTQLGFAISRDEARVALQRSEEKYRNLASSFNDAQAFAHIGSFEENLADGTVLWSDELYRIFDLEPRHRQVGLDYLISRVTPSDHDSVQAAIASQQPIDLKCSIITEDSAERVIRIRARIARDARPRILGSVLDITLDETAARERIELHRELGEARRISSLGQLAATIAHEFNNVLMGIDTFATVLARRATDEPTRTAVSHIQQSLKRGRAITEDILRFTRAAVPVLATIEVAGWLQSFLPEATALTGNRAQLDAEPGLFIAADVAQLNQVLANLLINARDASSPPSPITIFARRAGEDVDLAVCDRGAGIPPDVRERIFEPLFTTKRSGTGLGLAVVHQVVRAHQGTVRVVSEVGVGTEFHILLPRVTPKEVPREHLPSAVLLVEDEEAVAIGLREILSTEGIDVRVAANGGQAIHLLEESQPDALILDIGLPDILGTDLYDQITERWPSLPVIFISGHYEVEWIEHYLVRPHVAFLRKPFETPQLMAALARVV
ncbi:MAG TPA: ATP-binding protein [Thermoanaerobaculia bacterium]|nr:ATP-binding protein [Thermoanaerobaculia bacterium]